jgi:acetolactate synthase I/II/III large subunit
MSTTVEVMADAFKEAGTPFIVGHPGGESVELIEAANQREMRFILMKQETAGAMLAATWGEITGAPGVCLSTRGPGATNMVNGVAHAYLDRAPLIVITDCYSHPEQEVGLRQRIDQRALYAPVTKWGTTIDARTVRQQLCRAMRIATAHAPGPVQFDLPQSETTKQAADLPSNPSLMPALLRPEPEATSLRPAVDRIDAARKPIILAGLGVLWDRASAELVQMQGRDPGRPPPPCRLHHRRPHRAQARDAGRYHHHGGA